MKELKNGGMTIDGASCWCWQNRVEILCNHLKYHRVSTSEIGLDTSGMCSLNYKTMVLLPCAFSRPHYLWLAADYLNNVANLAELLNR
ncbi:hypothetical protein DPMN_032884 [Dreissena polymorpha]|uniref:Uncharacterized protein n=1 Tax=Dreissena polymorpha TaxID=45954 RepID=A0A9D4RIP7_DREPO|nr:hypothetical protein DPMN_032884 [Dreissena polymorpha]